MRSARLFLLAAASLAVLTAAAPALAQVQPSDPWAQAASDIPADSNVRRTESRYGWPSRGR